MRFRQINWNKESMKPLLLGMRLKSGSSNSMLNQNGIQTQTYVKARQEAGFIMRSWMKFLE